MASRIKQPQLTIEDSHDVDEILIARHLIMINFDLNLCNF